ncbi:MAG: type II CAAX endopeptidase family protein [bacterium]|nr:type II CAAX endopeptidase family protein [bacterium]
MDVLTDPQDRRKLLKQTLWVWFLAMVAIRLLHELQRIPKLADLTMILTAAILIYVPLWVFHRRKEKMAFFEGNLKSLLISIGWFLAVSLVIFPLIEIGNRFYQDIIFHRHYVGGNYQGMLQFAFFQLVVVAIPEEIFYRGFMQPQFNRLWGRPWRFLGAPFGKGLIFTSFLFALSHSLIQLQWWHFSIFFPGLVFGWLRERTGAVTASALFHATSNLFSYWVINNYR